MLSPFQMVAPYLKTLYQDTCNVVEHHKVKKADKSTGFEDVTIYESVPCRLSYSTGTTAESTESASPINQKITVFMAPNIEVKAGSKLVITHLGQVTEFSNTGVPRIYSSHQEIDLELFKGWS